jgi:mono/diheme cytochrome c family protein/glucose/arabinose dehydrogenase
MSIMALSKARLAALLSVAGMATGYAYQTTGGPPVLSPEAEMKTFVMPPGYRVELVASEPMIQEPVVIDWDPDGRLWVVEMLGYMQDMPATSELEPSGRVSVLEDTDGDGKMDRKTVFLDKLVLPRALKVLDGGVLVAEPPNLWLARDTDGDLRADTRELVTDTYGRREANVEVNANGLMWALDNWMYNALHDADLRLKNGRFELRRTLARGQWGVSQDDAGRIYRNINVSALFADLVPTHYFVRNPSLLRTRGSHEPLGGAELNVTWPIHPTRGVNRGYQHGILRPDGTLAEFTAAGSPAVYRGDRLPAEISGSVFVAEPAANLVSRLVVNDDGTTLRARKAYERTEFLASTDERFRPVHLSSAPDGTLYIVDMYRGIIQHKIYITEYLRDHIVARKLDAPVGHGRIYRVVHDSTRPNGKPALSAASPRQLVETLSHANGWRRDTAQRLLVERGEVSAAGALASLVRTARDPRTRLHALWTLDGMDAIDPAMVTKALEDPARDVRVSAIRIAERWLGEANHPIRATVLKRLDDPDWAVRQQLAASLGALPAGLSAGPGQRLDAAVVSLLERYASDPIVLDAALSGLRGSEAAVLDALLTDRDGRTPQRDAAITMLAATIARGAQDAAVQSVCASIASESRPGWQRSALLSGLEVALLGAPMPGTPTAAAEGRAGVAAGVTTAAAPCPTCPGGRAGPGAAYAFPREISLPAAGGGRGSVRSLRLQREPEALAALARSGGELAARAVNVLARVEWPGKPGAPAAVRPLAPDEQRRFAAGREVYRNICQSCHQADGRGQDRLAPSLIGSRLALGPAAVTARILLNGKEGPVGLMPPVGQVFSDDQIAAVLTYIRREWGHTASPVDAAMVKEVRALTAGRTRPWTNEELNDVAARGGKI